MISVDCVDDTLAKFDDDGRLLACTEEEEPKRKDFNKK